MSTNLPRVYQKIFGLTAADTEPKRIAQFGSVVAGDPNLTGDITTIQALSNWEAGWVGATVTDRRFPTAEETTGVNKVITQQLAYLFQKGIPEWDANTTYFAGVSYCQKDGLIYVSLTDNNINNNPATSTANWSVAFANSDLSNLTSAGKARIAVKEYLTTETYALDDVVLAIVNEKVKMFISLVNNNTNNPLTDDTKWKVVDLGGSGGYEVNDLVWRLVPSEDAGKHLLDGTLLSGSGINAEYVDFMANLYNNTTSTSNVQIVGDLTDNNCVLSGFSASAYATYQNDRQPGNREIVFKFKPGSMGAVQPIFQLYNTSQNTSMIAGINASSKLYIASSLDTTGATGTTTLSSHYYYVKIVYDPYTSPTTANVYLSTTGAFAGEETLEISNFNTSIMISFDLLEIGHASNSAMTYPYFRGEVDLKGCYIKANDLTWWNGTTKGIFIDEGSWQTSVAQYGSCGKFVYNSTNNTLRLPKVSDILKGTTDLSALGDLVEAGIPNVTATFPIDNSSWVGGAMSIDGQNSVGATGDSGVQFKGVFDASTLNSVFGNSPTVQPQVILGLIYIVTATSTKTEIEIDIDEVVTDLNNKADMDLSNVPTTKAILAESYVNGASWYRVYSDGWCEQGGIYDNGSNAREISTSLTFLKPYANVNYIVNILGTREGTGNYKQSAGSISKTMQGITIGLYGFGSSDYARYIQWYACGYTR